MMLEKGITDETIGVLKSMMNPTILALLQARGTDLRKLVIDKVSPQLTASLQKSVDDVPVYEQTRSILGSGTAGSIRSAVPFRRRLILLFSVVVPFGKALLVAGCDVRLRDAARQPPASWRSSRQLPSGRWRTYSWWRSSSRSSRRKGEPDHANPSAEPPLIAFSAHFGCRLLLVHRLLHFLLASQQATLRLVTAPAPEGS